MAQAFNDGYAKHADTASPKEKHYKKI